MLEKERLFKEISDKIAVFRVAIQQRLDAGFIDLNKSGEDFMAEIFNLTYKLDLINLNDIKPNFPGIDLGDEENKFSVQITSTKTSAKVDETLEMFIKEKHYEKYSNLKIFILTSKQQTYTLNTQTTGVFNFDSAKDIMDFTDLLTDIKKLSVSWLNRLNNFLEEEITYTIKKLGTQTIDDGMANDRTLITKSQNIIDIDKSLKDKNMTHFQHSRIEFAFPQKKIQPPLIQKRFNELLPKTTVRYTLLPIFNPSYLVESKAARLVYQIPIQKLGITGNHFQEWAMKIETEEIIIEYAQYSDHDLMTNLLPESFSFITILLLLRELLPDSHTILSSIDIWANGNVYFTPQDSMLLLGLITRSYVLSDNHSHYEVEVSNGDDEKLLSFLQNVLYLFSIKENISMSSDSFLMIDEKYALHTIESIRKNLNF